MLRKRIEIENIKLPKSVQEAIPVKVIYDDGIFDVGNNRYSRTYRFEDINYQVASEEDKETIFVRLRQTVNFGIAIGPTLCGELKMALTERRKSRARAQSHKSRCRSKMILPPRWKMKQPPSRPSATFRLPGRM